jgi:hypothetical protein
MTAPFWIEGLHFHGKDLLAQCFTETRIYRGKDPRPVILGGDAYWQWSEYGPYRNNGKGFCWTQALHDGLAGWHSTIFHSDPHPRFCVLPEHPDYAHVQRVWDLVNANVFVPENW